MLRPVMKDDVLFWAAIVWFFCMCVAAIWVLIQPVTRLGESQPSHRIERVGAASLHLSA
jgi:hypothetical protein